MGLTFYTLTVFVSFAGFLLAFYIRHKKQAREILVCPIGSDCDAVIHSEYSRFLGMPIEVLGIIYYGIIGLSYGLFLAKPALVSPLVLFLVLILSTLAILFSLYLTFIQAFVLRQWCTWCLTSASFCLLIFASALLGSEFTFVTLTRQYADFILLIHALAMAMGLGSATVIDILFFKFLKDFRISEWEAEVMKTLSQVIWFALAIIVISGLGLYLPQAEELNQSPTFILKMAVAAVLIINGIFLNLLVMPRLVKISFGEKHHHEAGELHYIRKTAFALGAISITSWYAAFILGYLPEAPLGLALLLLGYLALLLLAVAASQVLEYALARRSEI